MDEAGNVVLDQTTTGSLRQAISNKPAVLKQIITYPRGQASHGKAGSRADRREQRPDPPVSGSAHHQDSICTPQVQPEVRPL